MNNCKLKIYNNHENKINLSFKFSSYLAIIESLNFFTKKMNNLELKINSNNNYLTSYIIVNSLEEVSDTIKENFDINKKLKQTIIRNTSLSLGLIQSCIISFGYNGLNYFLNFSINLIKCTSSTYLIEKINSLNKLNGVDVAIIINTLFAIPATILTITNLPLIETIICISCISAIFLTNIFLLRKNETITINYKNRIEKLEININNTFLNSIFIVNMIKFIISYLGISTLNNVLICLLLVPLISYFLSKLFNKSAYNINEYLIKSNGIIDGKKYGDETIKFINKKYKKINFKYGLISGIIYVFTSFLINIFNLPINAISLSLIINSFYSLKLPIKNIFKQKKIKAILN